MPVLQTLPDPDCVGQAIHADVPPRTRTQVLRGAEGDLFQALGRDQ